MHHLAAFILRLAAIATRDHLAAYFALSDAADEYDTPVPPAWLLWNAPGGEA